MDAIVTFPPAGEGHYRRIADLWEFAVHSLKDTGAVFLLASTEDLPELLKHMGREPLSWVCAFHYSHPGNNYKRNSMHTIPLTQKLLLIFGKPGSRLNAGDEPITVQPLGEGTGREYFNPRLDAGMEMIIGEVYPSPPHSGRSAYGGEASVRAGRTEAGPAIHRGVGRPVLYRPSSCPVGSRFRRKPDLNQRPGYYVHPPEVGTRPGSLAGRFRPWLQDVPAPSPFRRFDWLAWQCSSCPAPEPSPSG